MTYQELIDTIEAGNVHVGTLVLLEDVKKSVLDHWSDWCESDDINQTLDNRDVFVKIGDQLINAKLVKTQGHAMNEIVINSSVKGVFYSLRLAIVKNELYVVKKASHDGWCECQLCKDRKHYEYGN